VASAPPKMAPKPAASVRPNVTTNAAANDPNCDFYPQTGHAVCGAIRDDYNNTLGGPNGPLGYPTSDELTSPDGVGKFNTFQNAGDHIYWSPATGAAEIGGAIFDHWGTFGYELGPLGYPTSGELPLGGGAQTNTFQGGPVITWSPSTGACEIGGEIYLHWAHFSFNLGPLGLPTSDEITNPDGVGKRNTFQYGGDSIYWSPATGAQEIGGAIFQHWGDYGYETGPLGYPISDEITNPDGVGKRNSFQNGGDAIYWSPSTPASEVGGAIFQQWGSRNYETGRFGYPTSDEFNFEAGRAGNFQGGTIDWLAGDPIGPADVPAAPDGSGSSVGYTSSSPSPLAVPGVGASGTTDPPDDPADDVQNPTPCGITNGSLPHPSGSRTNGQLDFPAQIHTSAVSECTMLDNTVVPYHKIIVKTSRLRWWGRPFPQKQIPFGKKDISSDGYEASLQGITGKQLKLVSAISCTPGTFFRYRSEFEGEFAFPGDQTKPYFPLPLENPDSKEVGCNG